MKVWPGVIFVIFFCLSCRNQIVKTDSNSSNEFIKNLFSERKFEWTDELEGNLLTGENPAEIKLSKNLKLNPVSYAVFVANKGESLYPYIEGFASLDMSSLNSKAKNTVEEFCKTFCTSGKMDSLMVKKSLSELIFFKADTDKIFPDKTDLEGYIYGKPFISKDTFEVPVCFISRKGRLTVYLYLDKYSDWKIEQIQIKKWQER